MASSSFLLWSTLICMIRSRLSYVRFNLKILTLLLPAFSYFIAVKVRFGFNLFFSATPAPGLPSYWGIVLLTTIVWALAAEESGLWNVEQLYAPGGKSRRLLEALAFTYAIVMALGFLYRQASYSRLFRSGIRTLERGAIVCTGRKEPAIAGSSGIHLRDCDGARVPVPAGQLFAPGDRSEEHTSELQSLRHLVC